MTDAKGQIVWQATYKAWGAVETLAVNDLEQNLRFQGQYYDAETGLHYNTFRYFDPLVGRFTTQDPIGLLGGSNLYGYAPNANGWIDPLGLCNSTTSGADDFFAGTKYTDKVVGQIKIGDLHAFPESVKAFQGSGQLTKITGGDGVVRDMLKIPGEYRGKQGVFEFIKEPDGSINHRLFKPNSGQ